MSAEYQKPSFNEIANGILKAGETPESFVGMLNGMEKLIGEGKLRTDLTCWEHKIHFFEMAKRVYVDNGFTDFNDCEIGIHEGQCESPLCLKMNQVYYKVLKPSQEEDSPRIAQFLAELEKELMLGKEIKDLRRKDGGFYDSDTGKTLKIEKAVDITDKCCVEKGKALLVYMRPVKGIMVDIKYDNSGVAYSLNSEIFTPEDLVFQRKANMMKIDPQFLHAIIIANAPQES